jgi:APA family basic amino acid/polyamine antiporter
MALRRSLNLFDATLLVVGNVVGAGIFTTSGFLAGELPNPWLFVGVWVIGGLLTLCGTLTYAEMSSMFPRSGGDYLFLKAAYGPWAGFLLGWICFWVINPGSIAVLSISIVKYLTGLFGSPGILGEKLMAVATVAFFSLINYRGVRLTGTAQNLWTLGSLAIIVFLIVGGLTAGKGDWRHFSGDEPGLQSGLFPLTKLFGPAMIAVIFSYSGWFVTTYIGDEVKRPERNLPLSLFLGIAIVMMLYVLINVVYLYAISIGDLKGVINVGQVVGERLLSSEVAQIVSLAIILAI